MENGKIRWRVRFSIRSFLIFIAFVAAYLASWMATKEYGIVPGTAQHTPIPFVIVESGVPHFSNLGTANEPFVMEQQRTYCIWFFGKQHSMFERTLLKEWNGHSSPERREIMKQIARSYGQAKKRTKLGRESTN